MNDNRGFTLIELIVVILIMGILTVGAVFSTNILETASVRSTAKRINSLLDYVQLENMTKNKAFYLVIQEESKNYYLIVETDNALGTRDIKSKEKLALRNGEITFVIGSTEYLIRSGPVPGRLVRDKLEVSFRKDTGGLRQSSLGEIVSTISITASGTTYSVQIVETTGKHYVE